MSASIMTVRYDTICGGEEFAGFLEELSVPEGNNHVIDEDDFLKAVKKQPKKWREEWKDEINAMKRAYKKDIVEFAFSW